MTTTPDAGIDVEDLSFRYPGSDERVLRGADLRIEPGEFVAVLGGNGCGKTTLCKAFNGIIPHFYEGEFEGTVTVAGRDTSEASVSDLSTHVGYVFQEFDDQLVSPTVFEEVAFGPVNHGRDDYRDRVHRTLSLLDLDGMDDRFVWELSGGQKHLVALAAALSLDPEILVVDEPAAQLDPVNARETYDHLARLNDEHGKTVVTIEHHTEFIAEYCDSVTLVDDGRVVWKEPVDVALNRLEDIRAQDVHPPQVTRVAERLFDDDRELPVTLRDGVRQFSAVDPDGGTDEGWTPDGDANGGWTPDGGAISDWTPDGSASRELHESPARRRSSTDARDPVVSFETVSHSYRTLKGSDEQVLDGLSLDFRPSDRIALVGSNGAGKSTLLKLATGVERPSDGTVTVDGVDTATVLPEQLAEDVVYVHQNPEEMFIEDEVRADVAHYLRDRGVDGVEERVDDVIEFFDLEALQHRDGRLLSVGQQRRASLAIGLATDPSIVLLDEPTGSLDLASREEVGRTIERAGQRVETVVVATHDLELAAEWATRVVVLDDGQVVADGPPERVFSAVNILQRANLRPPQVVRLSDELGLSPVALTVPELAERLGAEKSSRTLATEGRR